MFVIKYHLWIEAVEVYLIFLLLCDGQAVPHGPAALVFPFSHLELHKPEAGPDGAVRHQRGQAGRVVPGRPGQLGRELRLVRLGVQT